MQLSCPRNVTWSSPVGVVVGLVVGVCVGPGVGACVGGRVGERLGMRLGSRVGLSVGACKADQTHHRTEQKGSKHPPEVQPTRLLGLYRANQDAGPGNKNYVLNSRREKTVSDTKILWEGC